MLHCLGLDDATRTKIVESLPLANHITLNFTSACPNKQNQFFLQSLNLFSLYFPLNITFLKNGFLRKEVKEGHNWGLKNVTKSDGPVRRRVIDALCVGLQV